MVSADSSLAGPRCFLFFLLAAFSLLISTGTAFTQDKGKTILVLDASGSMWGEVKGGVKIDAAKDSVSNLASTLDPQIELGLMAYGHRRKGDCDDIELLVPPSSQSRQAILSTIGSIVPKGKTPLSKAVRLAAESLQFEEEKATVILVSDGLETCGEDPGQVGEILEKMGVDFTCHVIGFDLKQEETVSLKALAENTGGLFLQAKDADSLRESINKAAEKVVVPDTELAVSSLNEDGHLLFNVRYQLFKDKADEKPIQTGVGGEFKVKLEPGEYLAAATFGNQQKELTVTVEENKLTRATIGFSAAGLTARAIVKLGEPPIEKGIAWKVYEVQDGKAAETTVAYSYHAQPKFALSPGTYLVEASKGAASATKEVKIDKSGTAEVELVLGSGTLVATARMTETEPDLEDGLAWSVFTLPDADGKRKQVTYSYHEKTDFILPAGKYILSVKLGSSGTEEEVEVFAGETTEITLSMGAGTLEVEAIMKEGAEPAKGKLAWNVLSLPDENGKQKTIAYSYHDAPSFSVPSGSYIVSLKRGSAAAEVEVNVGAGKTTKATVNLNAGEWSGQAFMATDSAAPAAGDLKWNVFAPEPEGGRRKNVAYSFDDHPRFYLNEGKYVFEIARGSALVTQEVEIKANELREDKVILNAAEVLFKPAAGNVVKRWGVFEKKEDGGKGKSVAYGYNETLKTYLPEGTFLVEMEVTEGNEKKVYTTEYQAKAGKNEEVEIRAR